ncbi:MAG: L-seryl-tRNA(Sec) selenium transferase [Acidobacteria bacterium]|nr:L-seryl-tRNA(Sec) selenium transferase [Acidobacteriota bacterium]
MNHFLQKIPSVDQILQQHDLKSLIALYSRPLVLESVQETLDELRGMLRSHAITTADFTERLEQISEQVKHRLEKRFRPSLRKIINATGVILHTNVGRAPLAVEVGETLQQIASSYSNLEYRLEKGERGHRDSHFEARATRLLKCEAATVVNNNAAAVFLILNTIAAGKKVIVSRGELIEIGGSFRIPEIMERSGAFLLEVGTTNRTRIADYREAITAETGLILRVHPSNYKIIGFTERPERSELASLAQEQGLPLVEDVGSGYLFQVQNAALRDEPTVDEALREGVDLVCFSGDKLLGGPQAGIIVGKRKWVEKIRRNPLMRICRVDKMTYAALEWIWIQYEKGTYQELLPVYRMLAASREEIRVRAQRLSESIPQESFSCVLIEGDSLIGGGSAPEERLPTCLLAVRSRTISVNVLEQALRRGPTPILARIEDGAVLLDLRTVLPGEEQFISTAFCALSSR